MRIIFVSFALLWLGQLRAEQLFLHFVGDCGDLIRYEHTVDGQTLIDYYSFNLPAGDRAVVYLETDGAGTTSLSALPENYLACGADRLDASIADRVNRGETQLMIITNDPGGGYTQRPVLMATLVTTDDDHIIYASPYAYFAYHLQETVIGTDLDLAGEGGSVYFDGRAGNECYSPYLFYEVNPAAAYSRIDYQLYPGVGILERQLAAATQYSQNDFIVAREINGLPVKQYLRDQCEPSPEEPAYTEQQRAFRPAYVEVVVPEASVPEAATPAVSPYQTPPPSAVTSSFTTPLHTVARGETLYGLARRYAVSVDLIRELNGLADNTIVVGQQLRIGTSTPEVNEPMASAPAMHEPVVQVPEVMGQPATTGSVHVPVRAESSYHTVVSGETFASIARRYGYTKERFLSFNAISDQQVALVGQQLKTSHCTCPDAAPLPVQYVNTPQAPATVADPSPVVVSEPYAGSVVQHNFTHVVREGETLYAIARQYGTSVQTLRERNGLPDSNVIVPFQKLYVN